MKFIKNGRHRTQWALIQNNIQWSMVINVLRNRWVKLISCCTTQYDSIQVKQDNTVVAAKGFDDVLRRNDLVLLDYHLLLSLTLQILLQRCKGGNTCIQPNSLSEWGISVRKSQYWWQLCGRINVGAGITLLVCQRGCVNDG